MVRLGLQTLIVIHYLFLCIEKYEETVQKLQEAFDKKDFKLAKDLSIELQYWNSIQSAIHEWHP